jgi:hypothetical protein
MMLKNDYVVNFVFPILTLKETEPQKFIFDKLLGTGFLIGKKGFALTASHIFKDTDEYLKVAAFIDEDKWVIHPILSTESHPNEDVSIIKLSGDDWRSPFRVSTEWQGGWKDYLTCGYPMDVAYENIIDSPIGKIVATKPEMVHTRGYIRRIISKNLEISNIKGNSFYELSTLAGKGYSGGPIFHITNGRVWEIMGIYVAEKEIIKHDFIDEENREILYVYPSVAYAVRSQMFADWIPEILGFRIIDESQNFIV